MAILTGVLLLVIGLIACFFGWRFFRILLFLQGFVVGYYATSGFLAGQGETVQIIVAVVIGIVSGAIFYALYKFAFIVFGGILGLAVGAIIGVAFNLEGFLLLIVTLVLGVIGAILGNAIGDTIIRLSTAFAGSAQAIGGLAALVSPAALNIALPLADPMQGGVTADSTAGIVTLVAVIVLGVFGFIFQARHAPQNR